MKKALLVCLRGDREKLLISLQRCGELMPIAESEEEKAETASSSPPTPSPADAEALFRETDALLRRIRPYRKKIRAVRRPAYRGV